MGQIQGEVRCVGLGCRVVTSTVDLHEQLADAARDLEAEPDTQQTLERSVAIALELVPHADRAGMSVVQRKGGGMRPPRPPPPMPVLRADRAAERRAG